jgi:hypothetical protein
MGRRQRRRGTRTGPAETVETSEYVDEAGNVLALRNRLSERTLAQVAGLEGSAGASVEDVWQRRMELLFERLAVSWTIAELPLTGQQELLGRYRMADSRTRAWVRETIAGHVRRHQPEAPV